MIKLTPYFGHDDGAQRLGAFLKMVADVVPFFREDVLDGLPAGTLGKPRARGKSYRNYLQQRKITDGTDDNERKRVDARLAERLIAEYSGKLHCRLYQGCSGDGHVNKSNLRELLTVWLEDGDIPNDLRFDDTGDSKPLLAHVFRYEVFSQHKDLYDYVKRIGAEVCPYCNRLFTTTVTAKGHRTRPQLDHFKSKTEYPYLALSINNLVPSCGVCNLLKHDGDEKLVYPYGEEMGDACSFKTTIPKDHITAVLTGSRIASKEFKLDLSVNLPDAESAQAKRLENSIDKFALKELYESHRPYVADLYFQRYILTDERVEDIYNQFRTLFKSKQEVRDALLAMSNLAEHPGDRPLSKLTRDIQREIEALYAENCP